MVKPESLGAPISSLSAIQQLASLARTLGRTFHDAQTTAGLVSFTPALASDISECLKHLADSAEKEWLQLRMEVQERREPLPTVQSYGGEVKQ